MLPELLQKLAHEVIKLTEKQKKEGKLQKVQRVYVRYKLNNLHIRDDLPVLQLLSHQ